MPPGAGHLVRTKTRSAQRTTAMVSGPANPPQEPRRPGPRRLRRPPGQRHSPSTAGRCGAQRTTLIVLTDNRCTDVPEGQRRTEPVSGTAALHPRPGPAAGRGESPHPRRTGEQVGQRGPKTRSPSPAAQGARVVSVGSSQHRLSPVVIDDIHYEQRPHAPQSAYGQSMTANALFAVEAARRWAGDGITVNAVMPGVVRTHLMRHVDPALLTRNADSGAPALPWRTAEQGAATFVLLAVLPAHRMRHGPNLRRLPRSGTATSGQPSRRSRRPRARRRRHRSPLGALDEGHHAVVEAVDPAQPAPAPADLNGRQAHGMCG